MKSYVDWINDINHHGLICPKYADKVYKAKSKKQIMDILLDANGVSFIQSIAEKNYIIPYDVITYHFGNYINGKYIANHTTYTSCMFVNQNNTDITINTTLVALLNCRQSNINIVKNHSTIIYCDKNCILNIECPENSKCKVFVWGNAIINSNNNNIKIIRKK